MLVDTGETFLIMPEITGLTSTEFCIRPQHKCQLHNQKNFHMKWSLGPNHKFPCRSSWDSIGICCSNFSKDLPSHSYSENSLKNELLDNLLQPQLSQALLERERFFKQIYSSTFERCREQPAQSHAYHNWFKLGHHLEVGQKVLYESHKHDLTQSQKLLQRRVGPFTVTKRITNATY